MKNKKTLVAAIVLFVLVAVGATIAYFTSNIIIANQFEIATYRTETTETFTSPENWKPCDVTPKTISVTNRSNVDVAVRVRLQDFWQDKDGNDLADLVKDGQKLTSINFHNGYENYWEQKGSWYVYKTDLAPNATTEPLIDSVSLSCEANLTTATTYSADGKTAQTGESPYAGGKYHVKATAQTVQADAADKEWDQSLSAMMEKKANEPYEIDFTKKAVRSDNIATANGNGINKFTENGTDIYYYRGQIDDNNVIWADLCWKIVRTTATGGIKMIYNGEPTTVGSTRQCNATGKNTQIDASTTYRFNDGVESPADIGYKYGTRVKYSSVSSGDIVFTFSNDVSKDGDTYYLDTSEGQSISGTWEDERLNAAVRYHYFCKDGATSCSDTKIGYIHYFGKYSDSIYYLSLKGYTDIEDLKAAMFSNNKDSVAKTKVETWFSSTKNLDGHITGTRNYEDDLEDAVFCNDRSFFSGSLKGKDSDATPSGYTEYNYFGAYGRNKVTTNDNYTPSLDCPNKNDAFTKTETATTNGQLAYKIGLITADELTLAGMNSSTTENYLYDRSPVSWTASPYDFGRFRSYEFNWSSNLNNYPPFGPYSIRPMVSLKAGTEFDSGSGLKTDPYIVP